MLSGEILAVAAIILISLAFYLLRSYLQAFTLLALCINAAFVVWARVPSTEKILYTTGLLLYSFGLIVVRVIAVRSVSLLLLDRLTGGGTEATVDYEIASRIDDTVRFRLTRRSNGKLQLTAVGAFFAFVTRILYFITRQNP